ncbi:DUF305 domain-containing protein [Ornithinimicrobium cerasi]|uniref:Uncharacterized conserved protein, DUF305 family n=1 Tax=Ornithinimicrobium cerasi TaxID=2248773 RepID=A0A285VJ29_9MICO|nr:DUF305 domain-containing protein [Ornithinimicrobium cerasi]SOC52551.1 Uncharacterized conserved protein, DUF305 family [Ornithinimicrobium cerasi]
MSGATPTPEPSESTPQGVSQEPALSTRERWRTFGAPALAAVTVVALCLGVLLGWLAFAPRHPGDSSAEAGFARDMSEHHAQAVQMSVLVMQRTEDEDVRRLATDVVNNQEFERGVMASWLGQWELPRAREGERMAWMEGHDHAAEDLPPGVPMPGMASPSEIQQLTDASDQEAEVLYLQLMTSHHLGGVDMAQAVLDQASDPDVLALAGRMAGAQTGEVALMRDMLAERDAEPREDVDAWLAEQEAEAGDGAGATEGHDGGH